MTRKALWFGVIVLTAGCETGFAGAGLASAFGNSSLLGAALDADMLNAFQKLDNDLGALGACSDPERPQLRQEVQQGRQKWEGTSASAKGAQMVPMSSLLKGLRTRVDFLKVRCQGPAPAPVAAAPPTPVAAPARPKPTELRLLAVLPFEARKVDPVLRERLEEVVRTEAGEQLAKDNVSVLTGETMLAILNENGVDAAKACEASCALDAARELKARLFISGTISFAENEYVAFVRLFDSKNGRQVASVELSGAAVKDLRAQFHDKAAAFFEKLRELE